MYNFNEVNKFLNLLTLKSKIETVVSGKHIVLIMKKKKIIKLIVHHVNYGVTPNKINLQQLKVIVNNAIVN